MMSKSLDVIQEKIGYKFKNKDLLVQAFTRSSFATENRNWEDNEKLEFVGDKMLDFIVVKKLTALYSFNANTFAQSLNSIRKGEKPSEANIIERSNLEFVHTEGEMTEIKKQVVQTSFLSKAIEDMELEKYLLMSKGDIKNNVQNEPHVKEDLLEAIVGAIAIDSSFDMVAVEEAIDKMLNLNYYIQNGVEDGTDYVSYVQNWHQKEYGTEPNYQFDCDDSEKIFECELELKGYGIVFEGFGYSKKEAIRLAAKRTCEFLQKHQRKTSEILDVVEEFDFETSIGKLQMLADKKIITGLQYLFKEGEKDEASGNPIWFCECRVDGVDNFVEYSDAKKINAKKAAAFTMLQILITGRDKIYENLYQNERGENNNGN